MSCGHTVALPHHPLADDTGLRMSRVGTGQGTEQGPPLTLTASLGMEHSIHLHVLGYIRHPALEPTGSHTNEEAQN